MTRTTIMLPADLKLRAAARARERGVSMGEWIRSTLALHLAEEADDRKRDPLFSRAAVSHRPGPRDVAANHDKYLYDVDPHK